MSTLLTFIGRGQMDRNSEAKRYTTTSYRLPNGEQTQQVSYLGKGLIKHYHPKRVIIAGTCGSMWDELIEQSIDETFELTLMQKVEDQSVTLATLALLEQHLNAVNDYQVTLVLLPSGAEEREQIQFFKAITSQINEGERLIIDITHGFRYMPILAFSCMQFLQFVRNVQVEELLYGMLGKESVVYSLKQILEIGMWVNALSIYDHSGDIGIFAQYLAKQGWTDQAVKQLEKGAFMERITNSSGARQQLLPLLDSEWSGPLSELLASEFQQRLSWVRKNDKGLRECDLAWKYLKRNDYLRAVIYGLEGRITCYLNEHKITDDYFERESAKKSLMDKYGSTFHELLQLRNNLAHGVKTDSGRNKDKINQAVTTPEQLPILITDLFKKLQIEKTK